MTSRRRPAGPGGRRAAPEHGGGGRLLSDERAGRSARCGHQVSRSDLHLPADLCGGLQHGVTELVQLPGQYDPLIGQWLAPGGDGSSYRP